MDDATHMRDMDDEAVQARIDAGLGSVEELLSRATYWEDMDSALVIMPAGESPEAGVFIMRYDGNHGVTGRTLKEALELYIKERRR